MVKEQTSKRIEMIKQQVLRDKQEFKELLDLRRKYQLSALSKDPLLSSASKSVQLDRLFVITLEFQNPKFTFPQKIAKQAKTEVEMLTNHSLMLEV